MVRTGNVTNEAEVLGLLNPVQKLCWQYYTDPKSDTFGNAKQSALKAGFKEGYSHNITTTAWFKHRLLRLNLLNKAERVLDKTLDMDTTDEKGKEKADLLRVQNDAAKFVAKTLGKDEGYNERTEITGANGQPIVFMPAELMEKYNIESSTEDEVALSEDNKEL
jgi:hypothetical protein